MVTAELKHVNKSNARVEVKISNYPYEFLSSWIGGAYAARPVSMSVIHEPRLP